MDPMKDLGKNLEIFAGNWEIPVGKQAFSASMLGFGNEVCELINVRSLLDCFVRFLIPSWWLIPLMEPYSSKHL